MSNRTEDLNKRTKRFSLRVIRLYSSLPQDNVSQVIGKQLLRSGTSPGAQYREAKHARSDAEFISKLSIGLQELEEARYWLELLVEAEIIKANLVESLLDEARQLVAIFVTIINKSKNRRARL